MSGLFRRVTGCSARDALVLWAQIGVLMAIWWGVSAVSVRIGWPANLVGIVLMLALSASGVVRPDWIRRGADWLLAEMLLFFVPVVVSVVQYPDLLLHSGLKLVVVVVGGTVLVLAATSLAVDRMYRLEIRLARRRHQRAGRMHHVGA